MYKHNIYTKPSLIGFGSYQGMGALKLSKSALTPMVSATAAAAPPPPTGIDVLPTWAFIAIPVGIAAVAAVIYYKFA